MSKVGIKRRNSETETLHLHAWPSIYGRGYSPLLGQTWHTLHCGREVEIISIAELPKNRLKKHPNGAYNFIVRTK